MGSWYLGVEKAAEQFEGTSYAIKRPDLRHKRAAAASTAANRRAATADTTTAAVTARGESRIEMAETTCYCVPDKG